MSARGLEKGATPAPHSTTEQTHPAPSSTTELGPRGGVAVRHPLETPALPSTREAGEGGAAAVGDRDAVALLRDRLLGGLRDQLQLATQGAPPGVLPAEGPDLAEHLDERPEHARFRGAVPTDLAGGQVDVRREVATGDHHTQVLPTVVQHQVAQPARRE